MFFPGSDTAHGEVLQWRKRGANRKLAETTQKHFLLMISASGDKAGILTPPRASCLGPMSVLQLWTGEGVPHWVMLLPGVQKLEVGLGWGDVAVPGIPSGQEVLECPGCRRCCL